MQWFTNISLWLATNSTAILAIVGAIFISASALSVSLKALSVNMAAAALKTQTKVDDGAAGFVAWLAKALAAIAAAAEVANNIIRIASARGTGDKVSDLDRKRGVDLAQEKTSIPPPPKE